MSNVFRRRSDSNILSRTFACAVVALGLHISIAVAAILPAERAVLDAFYQNTGGPAWIHGADPSQPDAWEGPAGTECSWYGVICDVQQHHVTSIVLHDNHLVGGPLPDLTPLTSLRSIYVFNNQLTGPIPNLAGLTVFQIFFAYNNGLSGNIPPLSGVGLNGLQGFEVSNNQLTGPIPPLSGVHTLQSFYADGNRLTGSIPDLSGLAYLSNFDVSDNSLTGEIPTLSGVGLTNLRFFFAHANQLTGSIPSLVSLTSLQRFRVENNQLTGPPPTPPSPNSMVAGQSSLCPNRLDLIASPNWNAATGYDPWYHRCDELFLDGFDTPP